MWDAGGGKAARTTSALSRALCACGLVATGWLLSMQALAVDCAPVLGRLVSLQGTIEVRRAQSTQWSPAAADAALCPGDAVRVGERSRAALRLANESNLRLDQNSALTLPAPEEGIAFIELLRGALNVFTRTPQPFKVRTPFVNAGVEGTEFAMRVDADSAQVAVLEGKVSVANELGAVELTSGELAIAGRNAAPRRGRIVRPADAVQWALYYPSILGGPAAADAALREADALARRGRIGEAFARLDAVPADARDARHAAYRAELLLVVGSVDEAKAQITRALALDNRSSDARALQAIIAVVQNEVAEALRLAREAVEIDTRSAVARLALSYAEQARFDIAAALASAEQASELAPDNAFAWARVAELRMSSADLDGAIVAAQEAVRLNPDLGRTQSVLGFANLVRIDTPAAKATFERAIELDPADPLPRLGLGLAKIREGDLEAGRIEIEIAAILDPLNSLVRSYLGKAYYEEMRDALAGGQFALAKQQDPKDPTPWFYDAIRKQAGNRPVEALHDVAQSIELNDHRAVYRSRLLLDDDRAARTTSLAALYGELGFERLSIAESVKALTENLGNDAAHRQLAAAYANLPRHDIARVSEALQAQVRQPLTLSPIDPQLSTDNLGILRGSGPSRLGTNEFNQLFARDQLRVQIDGLAGSRGTLADQFVVSGVADKVAYAVSQLHYQTDGFRDNSRAEKNAVNLFLQGQLSPRASLQADLRHTDFRLGQTFVAFDEPNAFPVVIYERSSIARLNGRFVVDSASDWVFSAVREIRDRHVDFAPDGSLVSQTDARAHALELQGLRRIGPVQLIAGASYLRQREFFPLEEIETVVDSGTLFAYGTWRVDPDRLSLQGGLALEQIEIRTTGFDNPIERNRLHPKLGVVWTPRPDTTLRAAAFAAVKRPFIASQTLEPTQIAGFNQFFSGFDTLYGDRDGTVSRRVAIGIDRRLAKASYAGAEVASRRLDVPSFFLARDVGWKETTAHLYLYDAVAAQEQGRRWWPSWSIARSVEYEYEKIVRPQVLTGPESIVNVTTHHLPIGLRLFRGPFALRLAATYVKQSGVFSLDEGFDRFPKSTAGWIADASAEYRLPQRRGTLVLGVRNAFDKSLDLFHVDPLNPRDALGRIVYARLRLVF